MLIAVCQKIPGSRNDVHLKCHHAHAPSGLVPTEAAAAGERDAISFTELQFISTVFVYQW